MSLLMMSSPPTFGTGMLTLNAVALMARGGGGLLLLPIYLDKVWIFLFPLLRVLLPCVLEVQVIATPFGYR